MAHAGAAMTALRNFDSPAATAIYEAIATAGNSDALDACGRSLWAAYCDGAIGDADAETLQSFVNRRRPQQAETRQARKPRSTVAVSRRASGHARPTARPRVIDGGDLADRVRCPIR